MEFEAGIFTEEEVIRYIELLCELSNKASFSSQKRIVIETGLIRICRPQTEETREAYADRVRRLEDEVAALKKNGVAAPVADAAPVPDEEDDFMPVLEPAKAADIKEIMDNWERLTADASTSVISSLQVAEPKVSEDGKLVLFYEKRFEIDYDRMKDRAEDLAKHIERKVHKSIDIVFTLEDDKKDTTKTVDAFKFVESLLKDSGVTINKEI